MGERDSNRAERRVSSSSLPSARVSSGRLPLGASAAERTSLGMGVPVAPCCLDLEDDETAAFLEEGDRLGSSGNVIQLRFGMSSHPPNGFASYAPSRPPPSRRRSLFARCLFAIIVIGVVLLVATELSATGRARSLDPRPLVAQGVKLVKEKIPWERLPKISRR